MSVPLRSLRLSRAFHHPPRSTCTFTTTSRRSTPTASPAASSSPPPTPLSPSATPPADPPRSKKQLRHLRIAARAQRRLAALAQPESSGTTASTSTKPAAKEASSKPDLATRPSAEKQAQVKKHPGKLEKRKKLKVKAIPQPTSNAPYADLLASLKSQEQSGKTLSSRLKLNSNTPLSPLPAPPSTLLALAAAAAGEAVVKRRQSPPHYAGAREGIYLAQQKKNGAEAAEDTTAAVKEDSASGEEPPPIPTLPSPDATFTFSSTSIPFTPVTPGVPQPPFLPSPTVSHERYSTPASTGSKTPRTSLYNFSPSLLRLPTVEEFDMSKLPVYQRSSEDVELRKGREGRGKRFSGSTSSMTGVLGQCYFGVNGGKGLNLNMLSKGFPMEDDVGFTAGAKMPQSVILRHENGRYSIDPDKSFDTAGDNDADARILSDLGHVMEKLFTSDDEEFARMLKKNGHLWKGDEPPEKSTYAYGETNTIFTRSQLDCYSPYLPGNGTFDIKTRAAIAIRQDRLNHANSAGYQIRSERGAFESFEREYFDLVRSGFLKYQFQARIGQMDGCFVAYHNTQRVFGFEYLPIEKMDEALFGSREEGDKVFKLCLGYMERLLDDAVTAFPDQSVRMSVWAKDAGRMLMFAEPYDDASSPSNLQDPPPKYKAFEYRNTNYLDGDIVPSNEPVDIAFWVEDKIGSLDPVSDAEARRKLDWSVYCQVIEHEKSEDMDRLYAYIKKMQMDISSMVLPEGVDRRALRAINWPETKEEDAAVSSSSSGAPPKPATKDNDLPPLVMEGTFGDKTRSTYVPIAGKNYRTDVSKLVTHLRLLAKEGWKVQEAQDKRSAEGKKIVIAPVEFVVDGDEVVVATVGAGVEEAPEADEDDPAVKPASF